MPFSTKLLGTHHAYRTAYSNTGATSSSLAPCFTPAGVTPPAPASSRTTSLPKCPLLSVAALSSVSLGMPSGAVLCVFSTYLSVLIIIFVQWFYILSPLLPVPHTENPSTAPANPYRGHRESLAVAHPFRGEAFASNVKPYGCFCSGRLPRWSCFSLPLLGRPSDVLRQQKCLPCCYPWAPPFPTSDFDFPISIFLSITSLSASASSLPAAPRFPANSSGSTESSAILPIPLR
jgi:hypothetical protein